MKPVAFLAHSAVAVLALFLQTATAQVVATGFEVLPVQSGIYGKAVNIYVYDPQALPGGALALPVVYVPLVNEGDSACFRRLQAMMQQGTLPHMRMVAIEWSTRVAAVPAAAPAAYVSPKGMGEMAPSDDEWFWRFIHTEVVPAVEAKYKCNTFRALYIDEASPLGAFMLANHPDGFNAYLSPEPFVWFGEERRPELAKTFFMYYTGQRAKEAVMAAAEMEAYLDEYYLKTGRLPWQRQ